MKKFQSQSDSGFLELLRTLGNYEGNSSYKAAIHFSNYLLKFNYIAENKIIAEEHLKLFYDKLIATSFSMQVKSSSENESKSKPLGQEFVVDLFYYVGYCLGGAAFFPVKIHVDNINKIYLFAAYLGHEKAKLQVLGGEEFRKLCKELYEKQDNPYKAAKYFIKEYLLKRNYIGKNNIISLKQVQELCNIFLSASFKVTFLDHKTLNKDFVMALLYNVRWVLIHEKGSKYEDKLESIDKSFFSIPSLQLKKVHDNDQGNTPKLLSLKPKRLQKRAYFYEAKIDESTMAFYAHDNSQEVMRFEFRLQRRINEKFFRVGKKKDGKVRQMRAEKQAMELFQKIDKYTEKDQPIKLDSYASRSVIIALSKILQKCGGFSMLAFSIGDTCIKINGSPSTNQRGDGVVKVLDNTGKELKMPTTYSNYKIAKQLMKICRTENYPSDIGTIIARKKDLFRLLRVRSGQMLAFSAKDFNKYNLIRLKSESAISPKNEHAGITNFRIHFLNHLLFLTSIFEVVRRLYRNEDGDVYLYQYNSAKQSDQLPIGIAQARMMQLLQDNKINIQDAFGNSVEKKAQMCIENYTPEKDRALYGVVTGKGTIDDNKVKLMKTKLSILNEKANESILKKHVSLKPFHEALNKENTGYTFFSGGRHLRHELGLYYGSGNESDSDDSDYSDDEMKEKKDDEKLDGKFKRFEPK